MPHPPTHSPHPPPRPDPRRADRSARRLGPAGLPRRPGATVAVQAGRPRSSRDDQPAGRPARTSGRRKPDRAALTGDRDRLARWPNHQDPLSPARWPADRNRAHALQPAQHGVHQQPGRLCDGLHVLRHRQDGPAAQSDAGRDRGAGAVFRAVVEKRSGGCHDVPQRSGAEGSGVRCRKIGNRRP